MSTENPERRGQGWVCQRGKRRAGGAGAGGLLALHALLTCFPGILLPTVVLGCRGLGGGRAMPALARSHFWGRVDPSLAGSQAPRKPRVARTRQAKIGTGRVGRTSNGHSSVRDPYLMMGDLARNVSSNPPRSFRARPSDNLLQGTHRASRAP